MKRDAYGQIVVTSDDLVNLLYKDSKLDLDKFLVQDPEVYNTSVDETYSDFQKLKKYTESNVDIKQFDMENQSIWFMPEEYKSMDIAKWLLDQCKSDQELQRVGQELLLFLERNLFDLLRYLKYLVDTMRLHNIVWGVGRGSSVASYALYLIGIHKVNSLYYDIPIEDFLK